MLVSDDLANYSAGHMEKRHEDLITLRLERTKRAGSISQGDLDRFKENFWEAIGAFYVKDGNSNKLPLIGVTVNTGGFHWETVILDLRTLNTDPSLQFEHWNFYESRNGSVARGDIDATQRAIIEALKDSAGDITIPRIRATDSFDGLHPTNHAEIERKSGSSIKNGIGIRVILIAIKSKSLPVIQTRSRSKLKMVIG